VRAWEERWWEMPSEVGDKIAQLRIVRFSNSTDADNVLRVQGLVFTCTNADCSTNNNAHLVDLGTVRIGKAVLGEVQWDKPNKQFIFTRDNGDFQSTVAYTDDDSHPPSIGFKELGDRIDVANCVGAAAPTGYVNTSFDSVQVNKSAVP